VDGQVHADAAVVDAAPDAADGEAPDGSAPDSGPPDGAAPDATAPDGGGGSSTASPPAEIEQTGTNGALLLKGVVLAPSGVLDPGEVLVASGAITCVATSCATEPAADQATVIDTKGTISPGLIDSHNHLAYNFLPEWVKSPAQLWGNRYQWADDPDYELFIQPYSAHRSESTHFCPAFKWGKLRSVVHGVTTVQGQPSAAGACANWGIREANQYHYLGYDHMRASIGSVRDLTDSDAQGLLDSFAASPNPTTRYHVHLAEGVSGNNIDAEFDSFAGRDPRVNRHQGVSLLVDDTAILIHCVTLTDDQLAEAVLAHAKIVWSPSSNLVLYGATAPIQKILQSGIVTGIGPDWTPSGEDEILAEMRFALGYGVANGIPEITPERLWRMATVEGADVVGLDAHVGRLEVGLRADLAVFGRTGPDPYAAVVESRAEDVRLVLLEGLGHLGDEALEAATARNVYCDRLDACGTPKYLCVQDSPAATDRRSETLAEIHQQLFDLLEGTGVAPYAEMYHRGSELLELVDCNQ
jgi:cytosine/adenosine deaminase-related metal-dependent hydrolase